MRTVALHRSHQSYRTSLTLLLLQKKKNTADTYQRGLDSFSSFRFPGLYFGHHHFTSYLIILHTGHQTPYQTTEGRYISCIRVKYKSSASIAWSC